MRHESSICPACGQAKNIFTFALTKSLGQALLRIARCHGVGELFNSRTLLQKDIISISDYTNMTHLKYLGLVEKAKGQHRLWYLTALAGDVLNGGYLPAWVRVFNNKVIEMAQTHITLEEAVGFYQTPREWARSAQPVPASREEKQGVLFP